MECTKLLYECIGDLVVLGCGRRDDGRSSVATESDQVARIMTAPEPRAKRTVEGIWGLCQPNEGYRVHGGRKATGKMRKGRN